MTNVPPAWADLIEGLTLLATNQNNDISPLQCMHNELLVNASPAGFTPEELDRLKELGFHADNHDVFSSFRFGSA
jgi:hypothetical protein